MLKDFGRRIQRDLSKITEARHASHCARLLEGDKAPRPTEVKVISHQLQRFAVWFGGSMLASLPQFYSVCHTKEKYDEVGPSLARYNKYFFFFLPFFFCPSILFFSFTHFLEFLAVPKCFMFFPTILCFTAIQIPINLYYTNRFKYYFTPFIFVDDI